MLTALLTGRITDKRPARWCQVQPPTEGQDKQADKG